MFDIKFPKNIITEKEVVIEGDIKITRDYLLNEAGEKVIIKEKKIIIADEIKKNENNIINLQKINIELNELKKDITIKVID